MDNKDKKYIDRWEEKEFLTDWVKHAPAGSLDKSVDDILAELGYNSTSVPTPPAQAAAQQPRPAQPAAQQPRPAQPAAQQPRPAQAAAQQPRPAQAAAQQPRPAQPAAQQPRPAQPAAQQPRPAQAAAQQPRPAQPAAQQPRPAQPAAQQPRPAQPATQQPRPAQPATQQPRPAQAAAAPIPVARPTITPAQKPLTPYAKPAAGANVTPPADTAKPAANPTNSMSKAAASSTVQKKKKKDKWIWRFLGNILPKKGDGFLELLRKGICVCAIFVLVGSSCVLLNDFVLTPFSGSSTVSHVSDMRKKPVDPNEDTSIYPAGILDSFKNLYKKNKDTIGWITYKSTSPYWHEKLANPGYVVTQSNDNDFYLHRDFDKADDRNGTIYMDYRCDYSTKEAAENARVTILYGHNMYSGLMFANVNKLLDSLSFAQSAPVVEFSSLYSENKYKVFAVLSHDSTEEGAYNFLQTDFETDQQFLEYIAEARLRSWYNYNAVDVRADDQILILFTCSNTYQTTMGKEGRTILLARKVREGESAEVDISTITDNTGKLMPRQWYTNNSLNLPEYYNSQDAASQAVRAAMQQ